MKRKKFKEKKTVRALLLVFSVLVLKSEYGAMMTATVRKLELHLKESTYAIVTVLRLSHLVRIWQCWREEPYNWIGLPCSPLNQIHRIKDFCVLIVVTKTINVVISRCCFEEDGTDLFISACCTCSTIIRVCQAKCSNIQ